MLFHPPSESIYVSRTLIHWMEENSQPPSQNSGKLCGLGTGLAFTYLGFLVSIAAERGN